MLESAPVHANIPHIFILLFILRGVNCITLPSYLCTRDTHGVAMHVAQQHLGSSGLQMSRVRAQYQLFRHEMDLRGHYKGYDSSKS